MSTSKGKEFLFNGMKASLPHGWCLRVHLILRLNFQLTVNPFLDLSSRDPIEFAGFAILATGLLHHQILLRERQ